MRALIALLALWVLNSQAAIDTTEPYTPIAAKAGYLEDKTHGLDFAQVAALEKSAFTPLPGQAIGFGFSRSVYWFRFDAHNPGQEALKRLLVFEPTWLDHIEVRVYGPNGTIQTFCGGDCVNCRSRAFDHPKNIFEPVFTPGTSTVVVRVQTRDPFVVRMALWEERAFFDADGFERGYMGFLYGVLIAMALYNLFLFTAIRDRLYGFYVLYVGSFVAMNLTYSGYGFFYFWPHTPEWGNWAHSVFIYFFALAGPLFATTFLDTKTRHPKLHRMVLLYVAGVVLVAAATAFLGGYGLNVAAAIFLVMFFSVLMFSMGVIALAGGNRAARFFIAGTSAGLLGAMVTALSVAGWLPFSFLTYRAADAGMILDALFLSMALADRYKTLKAESEQLKVKDAKQEAVMLKQHRQAALGGLIGAIAHQMKQPLSVISLVTQSLGERIREGDLDRQEIQRVEKTVLESVDFMGQTIDRFRNYFRPNRPKKTQPLCPLFKATLSLIAEPIRMHSVDVVLDCDPRITLTICENELQQVILNLATNAIDIFSERKTPRPRITITAKSEHDRVRITIEDNGGGIPETALEHLFELFYTTKGERGTGIGLYLCKMIITESLGGKISAQNTPEGARFTIVL